MATDRRLGMLRALSRRRLLLNPLQVLKSYATAAPSRQSVIDIFKGEWSSTFPASTGLIATPGGSKLFEDDRITWLAELVRGFDGKKILELGSLEAGHTYMMHERGAKSVTAIEANSRSYLKCLCVKELFDLHRAHFLYGDAMAYTESCSERFDLCVASGILYHVRQPVEFLHSLSCTAPLLFLWTHYYDDAVIQARRDLRKRFGRPYEVVVNGRTYAVAERKYGKGLHWAGFTGGSAQSALWLTRDSLFRALGDCGMTVEATNFDAPGHKNGPALALFARRS